jgi:hypothetical protein
MRELGRSFELGVHHPDAFIGHLDYLQIFILGLSHQDFRLKHLFQAPVSVLDAAL